MVERMKCQVHLVQWCLEKSRFVVVKLKILKTICDQVDYSVSVPLHCPHSLFSSVHRFSFEGVSTPEKRQYPMFQSLEGFSALHLLHHCTKLADLDMGEVLSVLRRETPVEKQGIVFSFNTHWDICSTHSLY